MGVMSDSANIEGGLTALVDAGLIPNPVLIVQVGLGGPADDTPHTWLSPHTWL